MLDKYRNELEALLKKVDGYGEVRLEHREWLSIRVKNNVVEVFSRKVDMGGFVRVLLYGHGWGVATFNDLDKIEQAFSDARDASRIIIPDEPIRVVASEPVDAKVETIMEDPFTNHSDNQKVELALGYNEILRSGNQNIILASTGYSDTAIYKLYMNNFGVSIDHNIKYSTFSAMARAKKGDNVQQYSGSWSNRERFSDFNSLQDEIKNVRDITVKLLDAKSIKGDIYTVVLDPKLAGVFIHEAFGHLSEADFILENPQAQQMMTLGKRFGPSFLNIIDDGSVRPHLYGSIEYDDEGIKARKNYLVQNGVLVGRLHDRETASKFGEHPTGNSRAESFRNSPLVRMTNTAIERGPHSKDDIFDGISEGVYAIDAYGGQTQLENFSFSAGYGYMIRDGKPAEMVKDVVLQGNLFETLAHIEAIADDFSWARWAGMCGKGGQGVPVDVGAPHIRISDVTIGGE